ncbi:TatD related DNase [Betaproteobacteria bacterium]|nr:TatD related DNase [Betaproteobacteria bacterium]GHU40676.1 TatD related DNase [Betaproteobacteria bacterium]
MWIDSHCHLQAPEFDADRATVWQEACALGVRDMLVPAVGLADCALVGACCARHSGLHPAYGIHPLYVGQAAESDLNGLNALLKSARPVAIGEIGLDGLVADVDFARQEFFFIAQLKLARAFDLPVVLHVRKAIDTVLKHLRRIRVRGGIAHAFNGSRQQADEFLRLGFKLGFGGSLTYAGSTRIRSLAQNLPEEALALETDAPDIPPCWLNRGNRMNADETSHHAFCEAQRSIPLLHPHKGRGVIDHRERNTPAQLPAIGAVLAELRATSVEHIASVTRQNTLAALSLILAP